MNRHVKTAVIILAVALLVAGCSRKGIHMSKHRKSRKCNCPTFSENRDVKVENGESIFIIYGDTRGRI